MDVRRLVTLTFDRNVGTRDRIGRIVSGLFLAALGWIIGLSLGASIALSVLGALWTLTGVLSKCSIYYLVGYSTCPVSGAPSADARGNR